MSTARSSHSPVDDTGAFDTTPFLTSSASKTNFPDRSHRIHRTPSLRNAAHFVRRASSRRMLWEPSMHVCDSAVEEIEERQRDEFYGIQDLKLSHTHYGTTTPPSSHTHCGIATHCYI
ncbi:hypothetical protein LguiA_003938 [Lonicera macranthoides]